MRHSTPRPERALLGYPLKRRGCMPPPRGDAFISYAHLDNQPLPSQQHGWVTLFHEALKNHLSRLLGEQAAIWRDPKLQGNDIFSDEIVDQIRGATVLVSILTPRYLKSEWC